MHLSFRQLSVDARPHICCTCSVGGEIDRFRKPSSTDCVSTPYSEMKIDIFPFAYCTLVCRLSVVYTPHIFADTAKINEVSMEPFQAERQHNVFIASNPSASLTSARLSHVSHIILLVHWVHTYRCHLMYTSRTVRRRNRGGPRLKSCSEIIFLKN